MGDTEDADRSATQLKSLRRFMAARRFVAGRKELFEDGFSHSRLKNWCRSGRLVQVIWGVYSYGRDIETREAAWRASLVAAGPGSVLTGVSACELWGLVKSRHRLPRLVEVATPTGKPRSLLGLSPAMSRTRLKVVTRRFARGDLRTKDGLRLTRAALALIDLAVDATEREVRFAFLEACRIGLFAKGDVAYCFDRIRGRRGARKIRPLLKLWIPELGRIRSVFEGSFVLACVENGLPIPKVNFRISGYEVDCFWPDIGLVVELDGGAFHGDPVQRGIDRAKQKALEELGLTVIRVTYAEFEANPLAVIERIEGFIRANSGK